MSHPKTDADRLRLYGPIVPLRRDRKFLDVRSLAVMAGLAGVVWLGFIALVLS